MIPTYKQFKKWTLPSKYSFIGVVLALVSILIAISQSIWLSPNKKVPSIEFKENQSINTFQTSIQSKKERQFTYEMYRKIKYDMNYEEVVSITGAKGLEVSYSERFVQFKWKNVDGSAIVVGFLDGKVSNVTQWFLR